jgi:hypothetical protein
LIVVFVILAVFGGISLVIATIAGCIFLADGKLTLPNTNARKLMRANAEHQLAKVEWETVVMRSNVDAALDERIRRALERGSE